MLQLRGAQFEPRDIAPPALLLGELQHLPGDASTARGGIDIHAPQLHRLAFDTLQTKGSDDQVAAVRHTEATSPGAVIDVDPVDLLGQRTRDVGLESVTKVRRRQQAVDGDEQRPHLRGVGL